MLATDMRCPSCKIPVTTLPTVCKCGAPLREQRPMFGSGSKVVIDTSKKWSTGGEN